MINMYSKYDHVILIICIRITYSKYDQSMRFMHKNEMFYALNYINNHAIESISFMLSIRSFQ